jgi:hypothetical protein
MFPGPLAADLRGGDIEPVPQVDHPDGHHRPFSAKADVSVRVVVVTTSSEKTLPP